MSGRDHTYPSDSTATAPSDQARTDHQDAAGALPSAPEANDPWARVTSRMRQDIGEAAWRNWIKPLRVSRLEDGTLTLEANSTLARERVTSQYADRLRVISAAEFGGVKKVEVRVAAQSAPRMSQQKPAPAKPGAEALGAGLDPRYTFANFVVGKPNELAFAVARRTAESATVAFNPLFLYGGVGLGKTHLMHAIAWHIREQDPSRNVVYLSAEKFMYRFVQALRYRDTMSFKEQFRSVDVLMIDDVQFISGKDSTQEEFFHTFNALVEDGRQVIISADKSPTDLEGMEERLRSRLGWGMVADIHPADYELRLGILQSKAERARIAVPDKVLEFLAHRISSNVRELEGALTRIAAHASLVGREITIDSAAELLSDLLRASSRQISIDEIQKQVAAHYDVRVAEMFSARRARNIARPRQVAMYLAKTLTSLSYPEIGRRFGGRDHTTVMHAVRSIEGLINTDDGINEDVQLLRSLLSS
ncbi:MAG: chromosomal replication initiator protein DnaA [Pseudomonadota bacterium]|nr:chromosomal replication initiator protein DnaA [Pseudomonadota bacterium]MEC8262442.1 chromosomal replication initiator protein DnaA [Pseudomonadota bacterium]